MRSLLRLNGIGLDLKQVSHVIRVQNGVITDSSLCTDCENIVLRVSSTLISVESLLAIPLYIGDRSFR